MQLNKNQTGVTGIGLMIIFFLIGFFVLLGIRMAPLYLNNIKVANIMKSLETQSQGKAQSVQDIRHAIGRRFEVDDVKFIDSKALKIERTDQRIRVIAEYEARTQIFSNVDIVISFNETAEFQDQ